MKDIKQIIKEEKEEDARKYEKAKADFARHVQCLMVCGDGSGKPITRHIPDCPVLMAHLEELGLDI
jgi:hypothetical protein